MKIIFSKTENKSWKRIALFYISQIYFNVWFNRRQLDSHICFHTLVCCDMFWLKNIKKQKTNSASHGYVVRKERTSIFT